MTSNMGRNEIILILGLSFPFGLNSLWHLIKMIKRKETICSCSCAVWNLSVP